MTQPAPVMGPGERSTKPLAPTDPPMFNPEGDLQKYRRDVARWVETIQAAAEKGTDRMYKTVFATLGRHFYDRGLPREQKSIVDEAKSKHAIDIDQENQIEAVKQIVKLIAVDPPIAVVTRLISSFTDVTQCRRRRNEDLNAFVSRFRGLAADHLMLVGLSTSSQVSEVLAITLLTNAMLSKVTLTNAKLQLVSLAEARQKDEPEAEVAISKDSHASILNLYEKLMAHFNSDELLPQASDSASNARRKAAELHGIGKNILEENAAIMSYLQDRAPELNEVRDMFSAGPRCTLNLDDAVRVIRNLTFTPKRVEKSYTKADIENMVGQRVQQALAALQKRSDSQNPSQQRNANTGNQSNSNSRGGSSRKRRQSFDPGYCYDCGAKTHRRGSSECKSPSHQTKRLREEKKKRGQEDRKNPEEQDFQKGSNPSRRSHL